MPFEIDGDTMGTLDDAQEEVFELRLNLAEQADELGLSNLTAAILESEDPETITAALLADVAGLGVPGILELCSDVLVGVTRDPRTLVDSDALADELGAAVTGAIVAGTVIRAISYLGSMALRQDVVGEQ